MADDPYVTLGVPRGASDEEIRRAFRKLAKEHHPDVSAGNAEKFKKLSAAYDILGDTEKRRKFDRGEIDASGEPRRGFHRPPPGAGGMRGGMGGDEQAFGDIFSEIFGNVRTGGRAGARMDIRGQDVRYTLDVDFLEAVNGARKRVTLPEGGVLDLAVPEGVGDGQVLRLRGKGGASITGGEPGDALVEIRVRAHPQFKRQGDDILLEVPITIDEAVLGAKIEVPTATGRVQLTIPKASSSGRMFRLKGKGIRNAAAGTQGDQIVSVRIVLPDDIDEGLSYFLSEWRQKHAYDPGRK
jgi:DnaJ-class molecular chaperone